MMIDYDMSMEHIRGVVADIDMLAYLLPETLGYEDPDTRIQEISRDLLTGAPEIAKLPFSDVMKLCNDAKLQASKIIFEVIDKKSA